MARPRPNSSELGALTESAAPTMTTTVPLPDGVLSHQKRRAEALVELIRRRHAAAPGSSGHADVIVLIDHRTLLGQLSLAGRSELGDGTPLPASEARRLACEARIIPVVMGGASVPLDVGRSSRIATGAQKPPSGPCTAPAASTDVTSRTTTAHSTTSAGGRPAAATDLSSLAPVCTDHHHLLHDHGWELRLDHHRVGTLHRSSSAPDPTAPDPRRAPPTERADASRRNARPAGRATRNRVADDPRRSDRAVPIDVTMAPRC